MCNTMWPVDDLSPDYAKPDLHYQPDLIFYIEMDAPGNDRPDLSRRMA